MAFFCGLGILIEEISVKIINLSPSHSQATAQFFADRYEIFGLSKVAFKNGKRPLDSAEFEISIAIIENFEFGYKKIKIISEL